MIAMENRDERVDRVLSEARHDLAAWLLAQYIDESPETIEHLGHVAYCKLAAALDIEPDSDAVLAIVTALLASRQPWDTAVRMRVELRNFMEATQ